MIRLLKTNLDVNHDHSLVSQPIFWLSVARLGQDESRGLYKLHLVYFRCHLLDEKFFVFSNRKLEQRSSSLSLGFVKVNWLMFVTFKCGAVVGGGGLACSRATRLEHRRHWKTFFFFYRIYSILVDQAIICLVFKWRAGGGWMSNRPTSCQPTRPTLLFIIHRWLLK